MKCKKSELGGKQLFMNGWSADRSFSTRARSRSQAMDKRGLAIRKAWLPRTQFKTFGNFSFDVEPTDGPR
jgi:hypothetical protein